MTDAQLLEKLKKRSRKSLETAIRRFNGYVAAIIYNTGRGSLSREDMEELQDDVFLALWNNAENITDSLRRYIGASARNMTLSRLRTLKPTAELPGDAASPCGNPEEEAEKNELARLIFEEIEKLGPPDSEVLSRFFFGGQKMREIAAEMGLGISGVKMKIKRGRERLKTALERKGVLP